MKKFQLISKRELIYFSKMNCHKIYVYKKKIRFVLFDQENKAFDENSTVNNNNEYFVLWYDAKMKNYISFMEYLFKKRIVSAKISPILVVDKEEHMKNIHKIVS